MAQLAKLRSFETLLRLQAGQASVWTKAQCQQCECTNYLTGWPFYRSQKDFAWANSGKEKWVQCDLSNTDWGRERKGLYVTAHYDSDVLLFDLVHLDEVAKIKQQCAEQAEKSCERK